MSQRRIQVVRVAPTGAKPETLQARRIELAREYRRIFTDVWPEYTEVIGECGIASIAAESHIAPVSPNFPIHAARATAAKLAGRVAVWPNNPPAGRELAVIRTFFEIDAKRTHDRDDLDLVVGKLIFRQARFQPLEAEIPPTDSELIRIWHEGIDQCVNLAASSQGASFSQVVDPRSWLWEQPDNAPAAPPTPKPRIMN